MTNAAAASAALTLKRSLTLERDGLMRRDCLYKRPSEVDDEIFVKLVARVGTSQSKRGLCHHLIKVRLILDSLEEVIPLGAFPSQRPIGDRGE